MEIESVKEAELQNWFVNAAKNGAIYNSIMNLHSLSARVEELKKSNLETERTTRNAFINAKKVCDLLCEADYLIENKNISPPDVNAMRPDLVLFSDSANYILIELKTQSGPERQGIQELLAYSAAIKMQMPYLNDFVYIVVAAKWDTLLCHGARSIIMDDKLVLPLQCEISDSGDFVLKIRLDLLEFSFIQHYDPAYAMVPAILAAPANARRALKTRNYFRSLAYKVGIDCRRLNQSGFVFMWTNSYTGCDPEIISLTLVTVNQHWSVSEHLPGEYQRPSLGQKKGFGGVLHQQAKMRSRAASNGDQLDDVLASCRAYEAIKSVYPQSTLSYDLLDQHRLPQQESDMHKNLDIVGAFEITEVQNLSILLKIMRSEWAPIWIEFILVFGEFADFIRQSHIRLPHDCDELTSLVQRFQKFKLDQKRSN